MDDWNLSKASSYLLKDVVQLTKSNVIDELMAGIKSKYFFITIKSFSTNQFQRYHKGKRSTSYFHFYFGYYTSCQNV